MNTYDYTWDTLRNAMDWKRGTVTSPERSRAIIVEDGDARETWYFARYANCSPEATDYNRLRRGEKVAFRSTYLGNDRYGASEILRVESMGLDELLEIVEVLIQPRDVVVGATDAYRLDSPLGRGATATVWRATAERSGQQVAVKILSPVPRLVQAGKLRNVELRFQREAKAGTNFGDCPSLVRYLDLGQYLSFPFVVLELCDHSISKELSDSGKLPLERCISVVGQVLEGLAYLHGRGVIHRDVKPDNILVRENGTVCLADLGILRTAEITEDASTALQLTRPGTVLGSRFYMAPEQHRLADSACAAADIYSLGVSWHQLLTGNVLSPERVAAQDYYPPIDRPHPFNRLISLMMAYSSSRRPTVGEIQNCLRYGTPSFAEEVAQVMKEGYRDQHYVDSGTQAIAATFYVLPLLGFSYLQAWDYLRGCGLMEPPPFIDGDGVIVGEEELATSARLEELAWWAADRLGSRPIG